VWWGGQIAFLASTPHPLTDLPGTLVFALYTEDSAGNRLELDHVREVHARLSACMPAFEGRLAFFPESNEQIQTAQAGQTELAADGIGVVLP
jgi:hypothetical protein